jgi:isocitrate dehydrogenase kinase/phosphatase
MFPQRITDARAYDIARAMLDGFNRHYTLFRQASAEAKARFEQADWQGQQRAQAQRIEFYDRRVAEAVERLRSEFRADELPSATWQQAKLQYIGLLTDHHQPELAETFFNSVTSRLLHRSYFRNDFIFVRPAISTEYIENDEPASLPTYRAYYPTRDTLHETLVRIIHNFQLGVAFEDLDRDVDAVLRAMQSQLKLPLSSWTLRANFQIQVLSSLFYRNKGAYLVGKVINGYTELPMCLPILHNERGQLLIDTALFREDDLLLVFSFARAYFMVDMEVPSAYVQFLRGLPRHARSSAAFQ